MDETGYRAGKPAHSIMPIQGWYSAKELCGLPGMPLAKKNIIRMANRSNWQVRECKGLGGVRLEYHLSALPPETREYLLGLAIGEIPSGAALVKSPPAPLLQRGENERILQRGELESRSTGKLVEAVKKSPEVPEYLKPTVAKGGQLLPAPASLAKWQRDTMDARCVILQFIEQTAEYYGVTKAIDKAVLQAKAGALPPHIQALIPIANARCGNRAGEPAHSRLSRRTLYRWRELRAIGVTALAPVETARKEIVPAWVPFFLKMYRRPQKPSVPDALADLADALPPGSPCPSLSQCYRFLTKMSTVDVERGRRTGSELAAIRPHRRRDTRDLDPLMLTMCDGHSFKAKIAHPVHGKPFHPEVCAVLDAATRKAIGWSAGLAESAETVADALRHAIQTTGIPAMFYTDMGSGNMAEVNSHPQLGRYARLGVSFETGRPNHPQSKGLMERFQATWIRGAKRLATYTGKDMDGCTQRKVMKIIEKNIKAAGHSIHLMTWENFLRFLEEIIDAYNNRPHSYLPKITDESGVRRHMTPNEAWAVFEANGWGPAQVTETELADLFRPRVERVVQKGEIRWLGNIYFNSELGHYNGQKVIVEFEPQDGHWVYVRDTNERLICKAGFEKNSSSYMPVAKIDKAMDDRAARRSKTLELKLEEIEMERLGGQVIEIHQSPKAIEARRQLEEEFEAAEKAPSVVIPVNDRERWHLWKRLDADTQAGIAIPEELQGFYENWRNSALWRAFSEIEQDLAGGEVIAK